MSYSVDSSQGLAGDGHALVFRPLSARMFAAFGGLLSVLFAAVFVIGSLPDRWRGPAGWITFFVAVAAMLRGRRVGFRADERGIEIKNFIRTARADWNEVEAIDAAKLLRSWFRAGQTMTPDPTALRFTIRRRRLRVPGAATAYMGKDARRVVDQLQALADAHNVPMNISERDYERLG
jgi:hypothetical protein